MFNRNLLWPLLTALALCNILACTPEHRVEQQLVTAPSGNTYYEVRFVNVLPTIVDSSVVASNTVLELPVADFAASADAQEDGAKAPDANTLTPSDTAPKTLDDLPALVVSGTPVSSDDPYIRFRQALATETHGYVLYYPEDAVSISQFAEDLAGLGVKNAVHVPPCTANGRYFYAEVWFDLREGVEPCGSRKLILNRP